MNFENFTPKNISFYRINTDIGGMSFATDTSFLWIPSMTQPDSGLAVLSSLLAFSIMNLSSVGVSGDIRKREDFLRESENFFFSPTGFIMRVGKGLN